MKYFKEDAIAMPLSSVRRALKSSKISVTYLNEKPKNPLKALRYQLIYAQAKDGTTVWGYKQILTQCEMADILDCSQGQISKMEEMILAPSIHHLSRLLAAGVTQKIILEIVHFFEEKASE